MLLVLDCGRSEEASGFSMIFIFLSCKRNFYQKECPDFNIYSILSLRKLDQDGTLERQFFGFLNSFPTPREKPPKFIFLTYSINNL